jgi:hypothetical protein
MNPHATRPTLSRPLVALAAALFGVGVATGGLMSLHRTDGPAVHHAGTAAWAAHLALTVVAGVALAALARRGRLALLLAPLGRSAAARVRLTLHRAPRSPGAAARALVAALFAALFLYGFWRAGLQVLGGLDPSFTIDAWGGPGYLGAMYCHYLDGALLMASAAVALDRLLLGRATRDATIRDVLSRRS